MKRFMTDIEWLAYANEDFQCKENLDESAGRQSLKTERSPSTFIVRSSTKIQSLTAQIFHKWV
mgnify:CR=1 FL=1